jgi:hypothetical protein
MNVLIEGFRSPPVAGVAPSERCDEREEESVQ